MKYTGKVSSVTSGGALIDKTTVRDAIGNRAHFDQDILVQQGDVHGAQLVSGTELQFETVPDERRGGDAKRAVNVTSAARELMTLGTSGYALTDPQRLYVPPTVKQALAPRVDEKAVQLAVENKPMADIPRTVQGAVADANAFLAKVFPQFYSLGTGNQFDERIKALIKQYRDMGMQDQANLTERQAGIYTGLQTVLRSTDDLLQPASILPLSYLPDLFMAVPVWYYYTTKQQHNVLARGRGGDDPAVSATTKYFCDLLPNQRWADTFQMYNRRSRGLQDYRGDLIPSHVMERMCLLAPHFDHLVIMTPYHDVAGQDWQNVAWLRSIDPYVVGFTNGVPYMFVIARFSDSGVFPLYHELLAGTIEFLRRNQLALKGFNIADNPFWKCRDGEIFRGKLGDHLVRHATNLISAFDEGRLFSWLRGEDQLPAKR